MEIIVTDRAEAFRLMAERSFDCIISICDPTEEIQPIGNHHYVSRFCDCSPLATAFDFQVDHVYGILAAVDKHLRGKSEGKLLIHCYAGISRSVSIAIGILVWLGINPQTAWKMVRNSRPQAWPKPWFVKPFDEILNLHGELERYVYRIHTHLEEVTRLTIKNSRYSDYLDF